MKNITLLALISSGRSRAKKKKKTRNVEQKCVDIDMAHNGQWKLEQMKCQSINHLLCIPLLHLMVSITMLAIDRSFINS